MKGSITRRHFLKSALGCGAGLGLSMLAPGFMLSQAGALGAQGKIEASYYEKLEGSSVRCLLCYQACVLEPGQAGVCRVRKNLEGKLYSLIWENPCVLSADPVEKSPLHHVLPGSKFLALGTAGCNLRCLYCQNWQVAQTSPQLTENFSLTSKDALSMAKSKALKGVMLTFNDPAVYPEFASEILEKFKQAGLHCNIVTGGAITDKPRDRLAGLCDSVSFGLKGFTEKFYNEVIGGNLTETLKSLEAYKKAGPWLEITTLVIPTLNDQEENIRKSARWIRENLGAETPYHLSRFFPEFRLRNLPATPASILGNLREIALSEGLKYVYVANLSPHKGNHTYCHHCGAMMIRRVGYRVSENNMKGSCCGKCGKEIPGLWS